MLREFSDGGGRCLFLRSLELGFSCGLCIVYFGSSRGVVLCGFCCVGFLFFKFNGFKSLSF